MHNEHLTEKPIENRKQTDNDWTLWEIVKYEWYYHLAFNIQLPIRNFGWFLYGKAGEWYRKALAKMDAIDGSSQDD